MSTLKITDLNFSYGDVEVFKGLNFTLKSNKTLSIIGTPNSGKTTLLKILNGDLKYDGSVIVNGVEVKKENKEALKNVLAIVLRDSKFMGETVKEELRFSLENINVDPKEMTKRIEEINTYFSINKILNKSLDNLSVNDQILIKILSFAITLPSFIAIDDLLVLLNERTKLLLLNYLNSKNIILINVTSNMEDTLYTDYILCLYNGISAIDGKTLDVLKNEKILKRLGFNLPFYIDLSIQLELYGLIKKIYLNKEMLVDNLWK